MFVAFHKDTTKVLRVIRRGYWDDAIYETKGACTRAINKAAEQGRIKAEDYVVEPYGNFKQEEKMMTVKSLMTGADVTIPVNTPRCCDPSTETYWSM